MSKQHTRDTKLTLSDLIAKKAAKEAQKTVTAEVFIPSLEGSITVFRPDRHVLYKSGDMSGETISEKMYANAFLVYNSCKAFQTPELQEAYGVSDPVDIVSEMLDPIEIQEVAEKITQISGWTKVEATQEVKN